jgi:diguanylate cyclase (GGDEF)-like protein
MNTLLPSERLLAILELQNELVARALELDEVVPLVAERAGTLIGAGAVVVEDGALKLDDRATAALTPQNEAMLKLLSGVIAAHRVRAGDSDDHAHEGRHDPLTGLRNRRAFDERLESELSRARRHGGQFALCLLDLDLDLDLDRVKAPNEIDGHPCGDAALQAVAAHLSQVRGEDAAYRLEGDEFALVLIEASSYGAEVAIDRVTAAIALDGACRAVDVSWGVATFQRGDDAASMLARADATLYRAKSAVGAG